MQRSILAWDCREAMRGSRESLILKHVEASLALLSRPERRDLAEFERPTSAHPGLEKIKMIEPMIVFGRAAHVGLADFEKRAIIVDDLDLSAGDVDIERLIWSSTNTSRAIALGAPAWHSLQLLPIEETRYHRTPPIAMDPRPDGTWRNSIRIICHGEQPTAVSIENSLARAGLEVAGPNIAWSDDAAIHLHVGRHDWDAREPRLLDSWRSGKLVIDLDVAAGHADDRKSEALRVEHEVNGLICDSVSEVISSCRDVYSDRVFWKKLIKAGHKTATPLCERWNEIAAQVLS